ncbi:alpha/beta hydrolase [Paucibacter sp. AS339]|uniref:alpha/beta hydrolase n=1 Tax=Paucibacter hankyongi TaxID=3133434 RepID=UPI0030AB8A12
MAEAEDLSILSREAPPADLTLAYGEHPDQVADFRRGQSGAQRPLVLVIHGGFWKPLYDRAHAGVMSAALALAGWSVLTLEYRRVPGQPQATLADIATAIEALPARVAPHNGQLLLLGHSAGGHLALWAAATAALSAQTPLRGVVALAPAADLRLAHALKLGGGAVQNFLGTEPEAQPELDPMRLPAPRVAVTIVQGSDDDQVPPAVAQSYCEAFPNTRLMSVPGAGHFSLIDPLQAAWTSVVEALSQLS